MDPDEYLSRRDKWFVGGGSAALWAPCFPRHLNTLGFWDYGYYLDQRLPHVFTITVLDDALSPVEFSVTERLWRPSSFYQRFIAEDLEVLEHKVLTPNNLFVSQVDLKNLESKRKRFHFILWTKLDRRPLKPIPIRMTFPFDLEGLNYTNPEMIDDSAVYSQEEVHTNTECNYSVWHALGAKENLSSYKFNLSENFHMSLGSLEDQPLWIVTPFPEKISGGKFRNEAIPEKPFSEFGSIYVGLQYILELEPESKHNTWFACSVSHERDRCLDNLKDLRKKNPLELSKQNWRDFFDDVPSFDCSDPYISKYYWYRWYGLKLNMINVGAHNHKYPLIYEGIAERDGGWFRHHISYSAQCHMIECSWMHDPSVAKGSLMGLLSNIHENGAIPGGVGFKGKTDDWFIYHANYAKGILQIHQIHPDKKFLEQVYQPLAKYAEYFDKQRDQEGSNLYNVTQQYETGQEYNPRYLFAEESADRDVTFGLKGVDATVYIYELKKLLAFIARTLGKEEESKKWAAEASKIKENILRFMWNPSEEFFFDVKPENLESSNVKAAVSFYPFITDIVDSQHLGAINKHLLNPDEFWTTYPVPTVSKDSPFFNPEAEWKGIRKYCPWNGRVWPMTNSHICDALAQTAYHLDDSLRLKAAEFLSKFIRMMFYQENPELPNCYEHYNPFTGYPSNYRGVDDYMHSWVVDLIIRYIAGFQPQIENEIVLDPLPLNLEHFNLNNLLYKGHKIKVTWRERKIDEEKEGFCLYVNDRLVEKRTQLEKIGFKLSGENQ